MAPSLLQTLLREPTRSYQTIYTDPSSRPQSPSSSRRASSIRSTSSAGSNTPSASGGSARGPAWVNGEWEWSSFGGRGGLTGGPGSLHTPSVVGRSLGLDRQPAPRKASSLRSGLSQGAYDDDTDSVRSGRSGRSDGSVRTSMSAPGADGKSSKVKKAKKKSSSSALRGEQLDCGGGDTRPRVQSSPTKSFSTTFLRHEGEQTSRRYGSPAMPSSYPTSPNLSAVSAATSSSREASRSRSPLRHGDSGETTPSLTSSASSAPSSPPTTPIQPPMSSISALSLEATVKPKKKKKRAASSGQLEMPSSPLVLSEPVRQVVVHPEEPMEPVVSAEEQPTQLPPSPAPVPGKFYSVDELFALASADPAAEPTPSPAPALEPTSLTPPVESLPAPAPAAPPVAPPLVRAESDNASFMTALEGIGPASPPLVVPTEPLPVAVGSVVPRLRLTRTDSDQQKAGVRGSEELVVEEEEGRAMESVEEEEESSEASESEEDEEDEQAVEQQLRSHEQRAPTPAPQYVEPAASEPPQLAHFVKVKRTKSKRQSLGSSSPSRTYARPTSPEPTYEVIRSSKSSPSKSSPSKLSPPSRTTSLRSASPAPSALSSSSSVASDLSSASASTSASAATDVPDWLKRIRALGDPIQPLVVSSAPQPKRHVVPPPHWTVQQLRAQEPQRSRPPMNRPRSVGSLRARAKVMEVMPEEVEAEAAAAAEEAAANAGLQVTPAWMKRKDGGAPSSASDRARSPSPAGSFASSSAPSVSPSRGYSRMSRRAHSVDLSTADRDRLLLKPTSPLSRSTSLSSGASRSGSAASSSWSDADLEAIVASADAKPKKGLAKFLQPPLASSKAVKPPPVVAVVNDSRGSGRAASLHELSTRNDQVYALAKRTASLREVSAPRRSSSLREVVESWTAAQPEAEPQEELREEDDEDEDEEDDADSTHGGSQLSVMSAPQLSHATNSPARPPRNPARRNSLEQLQAPTAFPSSPVPAPAATPSPPSTRPPSVASAAPPVAADSEAEDEERRQRPLSRSFSEVERPSMHSQVAPPPVPVLPDWVPRPEAGPSSVVSAASAPPTRVVSPSTSARPFSTLIDPSSAVAGPSSLALSPRIDFGKKKQSRRFGLFKRSSNADLSSASSSSKRFTAQSDLVYEPLDAALVHKRIRSDEVLVEVFAVGVDRWDRERVWEAAKGMGGAGFVPGRAVVGKVVEAGTGVNRVKKGELVFGLNPVKKSGALASFALLTRDHLTLAPPNLSFEQLASLPAAATVAMLIMQTLSRELPKGSKVLVLNAHQGVGRLCLQLAKHLRPGVGGSRDLWMVAQCPLALNDGDVVCLQAGATEVIRDEPLAAINGLHEGSFDAVIDTIGGRRLYDASRRVLHHAGSFITTVGDSLTSSAVPAKNENFRSLRRAFFKKDKKAIAYWRVNPDADEREAVRDTLDQVRAAVEAGGITPDVRKVLRFAEARRTFELGEAEEEGVVVRVKEV
ncbi:hypothetical protein JCM10207_004648 [Rhodosporidiobolus poonsookiae]